MTKNYWKVVNYASNYWENYITNYFMIDVKNRPWVYTETVYLLFSEDERKIWGLGCWQDGERGEGGEMFHERYCWLIYDICVLVINLEDVSHCKWEANIWEIFHNCKNGAFWQSLYSHTFQQNKKHDFFLKIPKQPICDQTLETQMS